MPQPRSLLRASLAAFPFAALPTVLAQAQTTPPRTLCGYVQEATSGERLPGATALDVTRGLGAATNEDGFFAYTYTGDTLRLRVSYVGYLPLDTVFVGAPPEEEVTLSLATGAALDAVTVRATEAAERIDERVQMSQIDVTAAQIKRAPSLLGETDVLKTLQLLPGVSGGTEGTAGLYVRGGSPDQNLILLDGVPIYNVSHVLGLFSVFNADAVKGVTLTKGGFPARYGGRLSSVVEVKLRDGHAERWHTEGAVGVLSSRLTVDGPVDERTRVLVSGRRTYLDLVTGPLLRILSRRDEGRDTRVRQNFYDLNAKVRRQLSDRDALYLSAYTGGDVFGTRVRTELDGGGDYEAFDGGTRWGNVVAAVRWNRELNRRPPSGAPNPIRSYGNLTATYSRYRIRFLNSFERERGGEFERSELDYFSGIEDVGLRYDLSFAPGPAHRWRLGGGLTHHTYSPGASTLQLEMAGVRPVDTLFGRPDTEGWEGYAYAEDEWRLSPRLSLNAGLHASAFRSGGATYGSLQPRLSGRYRAGGGLAVKASFATMAQYINLLTSEALSLPTDLWIPTTAAIRPQRAWQAAVGVAGVWRGVELSAEGFYKEMDGVTSYLPGASFAGFRPEETFDELVTQGTGRVYGVELLAQRRVGRTTGWLGYTLSWNTRVFAEVNAGRRFPFRYDRRHDVSLLVSHELSARVTLSGSWIYATGNAYTLPRYRVNTDFRYVTDLLRPGAVGEGFRGVALDQTVGKNDYRLSATHRLDLSVELTKPKRFFRRRGERSWVWGVYNAYFHRNPVYVRPATRVDPDTGEEGEEYVEYSLLPLIPSVGYRFKF